MTDEAALIEAKLNELQKELSDPHLRAAIVEIKDSFQNKRRLITDLVFKDLETGLFHNSYFHSRLEEEISRSQRYGRNLSVLVIEISTEDKRLFIHAGQVLSALIRKSDTLAYHSPGIFSVLLPETSGSNAQKTAQKIKKELMETSELGSVKSLHIGFSEFDSSRNTPDKIITGAKESLARSKKMHRDITGAP